MSVDLGTEAPGKAWQNLASAMAALPASQDIPDPPLPACHAEGTAQKQKHRCEKSSFCLYSNSRGWWVLCPVPGSWSRTLALLCADAHHGNVERQNAKWFELLKDCPGVFRLNLQLPKFSHTEEAWEEEWCFQAKTRPTRRNEEVLTMASSAFQFFYLVN